MTPLEIIIGLGIALATVAIVQGWLGARVNARERRRADHYRQLYLNCPRSITEAHEWALERGRSEGYQKCLDDLDHDRPAVPAETAVMTVAASLRPLFEKAFGPPEWNDPAHVPAVVMAELEPPTLQARAIEAPGPLTVETEAIRGEFLAKMDAIRTQTLNGLR